MRTGEQLKKDIIRDMRVELSDEFDANFNRKAFFTERWKKRRDTAARGSLLVVTGKLRRSIQAQETADGVRFSSQVPYATLHNEGGTGSVSIRSHTRTSRRGKTHNVRQHTRKINVPQRQFVGDGDETQRIISEVINDNITAYTHQLNNTLKQK